MVRARGWNLLVDTIIFFSQFLKTLNFFFLAFLLKLNFFFLDFLLTVIIFTGFGSRAFGLDVQSSTLVEVVSLALTLLGRLSEVHISGLVNSDHRLVTGFDSG